MRVRPTYCKRCDFYTDHVSTAHDGLAERGLLRARPVTPTTPLPGTPAPSEEPPMTVSGNAEADPDGEVLGVLTGQVKVPEKRPYCCDPEGATFCAGCGEDIQRGRPLTPKPRPTR